MHLRRVLAILSLMFLAMPVWAEPNPADYTLNVHVISSRIETDFAGKIPASSERLRVLIDGKKYDLARYPLKTSFRSFGVIVPGDYKARIVDEKYKSTYLFTREYQFLFPDQTVAKFQVIGQTE